jgi:hypothetical protein
MMRALPPLRPSVCGKNLARTRLTCLCVVICSGCGKPPTAEECNALLEHYVELLVNSDRPGTSAAELQKLQSQAREKAKTDAEFRACTERVSRRAFDCAMGAPNADILEQCLL